MTITTLDWSKPIQLRNGEPLELVDTFPNGYAMFPECTRQVLRPNETQPMAAMWFVKEDGLSRWSDFDIINRPDTGDQRME